MKKIAIGFILGVIVSFMAVAVLVYFPFTNNASTISTSTKRPIDGDILFALIQEWRIQNGVAPYIKNQELCNFANDRLKEVKEQWNHDGFHEQANKKYTQFELTGENLIRLQNSEKEALESWLKSPEHLKNLKTDFKYTCLVTDGNYVVQIFGNY